MNESVSGALLVELLLVRPRTDYDVGFNAALIMLLKRLQGLEIIDQEPTFVSTSTDSNERHLGFYNTWLVDSGFRYLTSEKKAQLYTFIRTKQKLSAIKYLKEIAGLGLKEAADKINLIFKTYETNSL